MAKIIDNSQPMRWTLFFAVLTAVFALPMYAQSSPANPTSAEQNPQASPSTAETHSTDSPKTDVSVPATPEEMRQAQIEADTKKLYQLSAELRAEVAKTYKQSLSVSVLKKAQELEKLAKSLKAQMKQEAAAAKN